MPEGKGLKMENEVEAQLLHNEKIKSEPNVKQDLSYKKPKIGKEEIVVVEGIKDISQFHQPTCCWKWVGGTNP